MNESGIEPLGYRVLVKPDEIEEVTEGGIIIPNQIKDQHSQAQVSGELVDFGEFAWDQYKARWAKRGDRVLFAKYGGIQVTGKDGKTYRMLNDDQITARVEEGVGFSDFVTRKPVGEEA